MPGRKAKPPRLWLRREPDGTRTWVILDRGRQIRTGCGEPDTDGAAKALSAHIARGYRPAIGIRDPASLPTADVLTAYAELKQPHGYGLPYSTRPPDHIRRHDDLLDRLARINEFFGARNVADIRAQTCRDYVGWRTGESDEHPTGIPRRRPVSISTARRELEDLRAAIRVYHGEHTLTVVPKITLPEKGVARDRWLTRTEAARLLGAALGYVWDAEARTWKRGGSGSLMRRDRVTRTRRRHAARFILVGLYSGRREATIRRTTWMPSPSAPWIDLERWVYHGRGREERQTKKRRPPAKVAMRLRPHLMRWQRLDTTLAAARSTSVLHIVHRPDGRPLADKIKTGWAGILADAGLERDVVRHTLRHTAATWMMQAGVDLWAAAGFLGMTVEMLQETYGHHHPDFQEEAAAAYGRRTENGRGTTQRNATK